MVRGLAACAGVRGGLGEPVSGTLSWAEEDTGAALMKGPAAGGPSGYADQHSNWPDEMRRIQGEVRRRRTEAAAAGSQKGTKLAASLSLFGPSKEIMEV